MAELGRREREVLAWVTRGATNAEIAREMDITEATVKTHLHRIFGKLGATRRTQAIMIGLQRGLVTVERTD